MSEGANFGKARFPVWHAPDGKSASCVEKPKLLKEGLEGIRTLAHEALEDAVLILRLCGGLGRFCAISQR